MQFPSPWLGLFLEGVAEQQQGEPRETEMDKKLDHMNVI